MKNAIVIILFASLSSCRTFGQSTIRSDSTSYCTQSIDEYTKKNVYVNVNNPPEFPGGQIEFLKFFSNNFLQSEQAENIQLSFKLEFIIDKDGNVFGERIKGKKRSELMPSEVEALRVISIMPKWVPGKCDYKNVPVKVKLPVKL